MSHQFTIQFTEAHIKYACRKFFVRYVGIGFSVVCLLMVIALVQRAASGHMDILTGCCLAIVVMGVGLFLSAYIQRRSYLLSQLRKTGSLVSYELSDEFFKAKSKMGSMELKWEAFKGLWIFPKVWLLLFDKAGFLTLPVDQVSSEVQEFVKRKVISVGGKVK